MFLSMFSHSVPLSNRECDELRIPNSGCGGGCIGLQGWWCWWWGGGGVEGWGWVSAWTILLSDIYSLVIKEFRNLD